VKRLRYVDLGTKKGNALDVACTYYNRFNFPKPKKNQCLGVDAKMEFQIPVTQKGYAFRQAIIPNEFDWPEADVYMAWNFLEHARDIVDALNILDRMVCSSRVGVWLLLPSFEEKDRARMNAAGFDFPYVDWNCHRAPFQLKHVDEVLAEHTKRVVKVEKVARHFHKDSSRLMALQDETPPATFVPAIAGGWEVAVTLRSL